MRAPTSSPDNRIPRPFMPDHRDAWRRSRSIAKYHRRAVDYDRTSGPTWPIRVQAIDALQLRPGDHVLDVGCGTGLSLSLLVQAVGPTGMVFGFDQSPAMFERSQARLAQADWSNVHLSLTSAEDLTLPCPVDAMLFHYTHDILRSQPAIERVLSLAKPGARVAIAGIKYFPGLLCILNPWVYLKNHGYNGAPGELKSPWDRIAPLLVDWKLSQTQWGMGYIATGRLPPVAGPDPTDMTAQT